MAKRILVVDDEPEIGNVLASYLEREGFEPVVRHDVRTALESLGETRPDMMILDITLPDGSGLDILRAGSEAGRIPAIMLTARTDEIDRVLGLELGADDYVTKPFSPREIVARVRAVLRRSGGAQGEPPGIIRIRGLAIDPRAHEVRVDGKLVNATPSEFRILSLLAQHPGQVFTRAQLLDCLNDEGTIFERTLDRHINNLRKKIEPKPEDPTYVITVFGVGYKMRKERDD
jgi:two-component system alkaline phosphatase synthesis response regulator PhoP